jgi:hypothetical protein
VIGCINWTNSVSVDVYDSGMDLVRIIDILVLDISGFADFLVFFENNE